jgi:hypothetical protein
MSVIGMFGAQMFCCQWIMHAAGPACDKNQPQVTRHTSHVTRHTSHVTRHTSHVTRHTSHVTRHTSHVTRGMSRVHHIMMNCECQFGEYVLPPCQTPEQQAFKQSSCHPKQKSKHRAWAISVGSNNNHHDGITGQVSANLFGNNIHK